MATQDNTTVTQGHTYIHTYTHDHTSQQPSSLHRQRYTPTWCSGTVPASLDVQAEAARSPQGPPRPETYSTTWNTVRVQVSESTVHTRHYYIVGVRCRVRCNGRYNDWETPLAKTSHWTMSSSLNSGISSSSFSLMRAQDWVETSELSDLDIAQWDFLATWSSQSLKCNNLATQKPSIYWTFRSIDILQLFW